jgi:hypothetical protein
MPIPIAANVCTIAAAMNGSACSGRANSTTVRANA